MRLIKTVFGIMKKPLEVALKQIQKGNGVVGNLSDLCSIFLGGESKLPHYVKTSIFDTKLLTTLNNFDKDNKFVDPIVTEASSYISAMTREFHKTVSDIGITKAELDEYTALYILERLNCPPKYTEAIIKSLALSRKVKESGIIHDASEVSKLHIDNIKGVIKTAKDLCSVDYLLEELESDMKVNKICTNEGSMVYVEREEKMEKLLNSVSYKATDKNFNNIMKRADIIFDDCHKSEVDDYYTKHFENIKKTSEINSDERIMIVGRNR